MQPDGGSASQVYWGMHQWLVIFHIGHAKAWHNTAHIKRDIQPILHRTKIIASRLNG